MEYIASTLNNLIHQTAFFNLTWGNYVMILVACFFLYLAIRHEFEPLLLLPIAFGMLLVNIYPDIMLHPENAANGAGGLLYYFYKLDELAILPSLIFMGVGAMTDFGPLIANPKSFLLGSCCAVWYLRSILRSNLARDSTTRQLQQSPSSVVLTALPPSSLPVSWDRRRSWDLSQWQHIPTCHWFPLSSPLL